MPAHYIKIALRFMRHNSTLTTINIIGLTIGLCAGLMIYIWVDDELHFETFHHHADHIYRVIQLENSGAKNVYNSSRLGDEMQKLFPQISDHTFISCDNDYSYFLWKGTNINAWTASVDKNFFTFFNFTFVEGNPETASIDAHSIVISENFARKIFGKEPALGQELIQINQFSGSQQHYRIAGVVKLPHNTHLSFDVSFPKMTHELIDMGAVYLRFDEKAVFNEPLQEALCRYLVDHSRSNNLIWFQPLKTIHLKSDFLYRHDHNLGNSQYVITFSILALIIVLMGAFNFMTITTAQATNRIKEVAVRKTYGGRKNQLMYQFFSETLMQVLIAMFLALALTKILLPYLNSFTDKEMFMNFSLQFWISALLSLFIVVFIAGSYPSLYLSSLSPMMIFKGGNSSGKKTNLTQTMVVIQFVISISMLICTLVVFRQISYIGNKDLGIDKENIITARCGLWYQVNTFKQEVMQNPNVLSVSMSLLTPESFSFEMQNVTWENKSSQDTVRMNLAIIDGDFAATYGLEVVSGELMRTSGEDYWNNSGVMINETAARIMGFDNPVGKTINGDRIVAVVRDFHFRPLKEPILPLIMGYNKEGLTNISFKIAPGNMQSTIAFIKETYERMRPGMSFEYRFFDEQLNERYKTENQLGRLFMVFAFLSLVISSLGILGLTAISAQQRTKEIAVRKILGASVMNIMWMLNKTYMLRIAIAFVIAVPPSALLMHRWLQNFAYRVALNWWIFTIAGLITLIFATATIAWLCYRAANQNPVNYLRKD